jgi:hypothetical protein
MRMPRVRFTVQRLMVVVAIVGLTLGALEVVLLRPYRRIVADHTWYYRVRADYEALAQKRPQGVTRGQWEFLVRWTENLHGNYGPYLRDRRRADRFVTELEDRLRAPVSSATIDWIWDEYPTFSPGSRNYDRNYRPTRSPDLATAQPGCFGNPVP